MAADLNCSLASSKEHELPITCKRKLSWYCALLRR